jgi:hypothetical protein
MTGATVGTQAKCNVSTAVTRVERKLVRELIKLKT